MSIFAISAFLLSGCSDKVDPKSEPVEAKLAVELTDVQANILWAYIIKDVYMFMDNPNNKTLIKELLEEKLDYTAVIASGLALEYEQNELRANQKYKDKIVYVKDCKVKRIAELSGMPTLRCDTGRYSFVEPLLAFRKDDQQAREGLIKISEGNYRNFFCVVGGSSMRNPILGGCRFEIDVLDSFAPDIERQLLSDPLFVKAVIIASEHLNKSEQEACSKDIFTCKDELDRTKFKVLSSAQETVSEQRLPVIDIVEKIAETDKAIKKQE